MSINNAGEILSDKITDLTESLYRTTDVLSSADRMIDHYRDLSKQQEHEIAKLKGNLHRVRREKKSTQDSTGFRQSHSTFKDEFDSSYSSIEDQYLKSSQPTKSRVHFQDVSQTSKLNNLQSSVHDVNRRQYMLEEELSNRDRLQDRDIDRMDVSLQQQLSSLREESKNQSILDERLKALQDKIEKDHDQWKTQQVEMNNLTKEMSNLKEVVKEVATPMKKVPRQTTSPTDSEIDKELQRYKKRIIKDKEIISVLQQELRSKEKEKNAFESTVNEIQSIGNMKNNQLKLLEDQLEKEKNERDRLENHLKELQHKTEHNEKERNEMLQQFADFKAESTLQKSALERSSQNVPELKMLLERSERQRDKLSEHIYKLKSTIESKDAQIDRLMNQINETTTKVSDLDAEKKTLINQSDSNQQLLYDVKNELEHTKKLLVETTNKYKDSERSKRELKEKAIHTLKEYRQKCRRYEQQIEDAVEQHKAKEAEAAREMSRAKEIEIANLKLQKDQQELIYELESLKQEFNGRDKRLNQLLDDRNHAEQVLQEASNTTKDNNDLKRELQEFKNEKLTMSSQLLEEKRKVKEFESLLHENYEKQLAAKDQMSSLQRQLQEERDVRNQLAARLQQEQDSSSRIDMRRLEKRNKDLEDEKTELKEKLSKLEHVQMDMARSMEYFEKDKSDNENKEKLLSQKLKKLTEDNSRMRKQYIAMKKSYEEKVRTIEASATMEKDQKDTLQNHVNEYQGEIAKVKDAIKMLMSIAMRDVENILNLLCREDENMQPIKEIPDSMSPEHQKVLREMREKLQTCYSISKTLKQKFQQQKSIIKKAQERLKRQTQEVVTLRENSQTEKEEFVKNISKLEREQKTSEELEQENDKQIAKLQHQVKQLTKHLEECTNALQKSLEMEEDRQKVLKEIDELRNEQQERQKMDETYYRNTEKVEILTEQLSDAKGSLEQIKQDTLDSSVFTNRVLETFSSVSPCRKRSLFNQPPSRLKMSRASPLHDSSSYVPTYLDELDNSPTRDVKSPAFRRRILSPTKLRVDTTTNDLDPMSMTDEEFDKAFLPKRDSSRTSPAPPSKTTRQIDGN